MKRIGLEHVRSVLTTRVPVLSQVTSAAVAMILRTTATQQLEVLFIKRAQYEGDPWSGHIAFPGGKLEPKESPFAAVLREVEEELGLKLTKECLVGQLDDCQMSLADKSVSCFVMTLPSSFSSSSSSSPDCPSTTSSSSNVSSSSQTTSISSSCSTFCSSSCSSTSISSLSSSSSLGFVLSPEVERVVWVPLSHLYDPASHHSASVPFRRKLYRVPAIDILPQGPVLWGLTHRFVMQLLLLLDGDQHKRLEQQSLQRRSAI